MGPTSGKMSGRYLFRPLGGSRPDRSSGPPASLLRCDGPRPTLVTWPRSSTIRGRDTGSGTPNDVQSRVVRTPGQNLRAHGSGTPPTNTPRPRSAPRSQSQKHSGGGLAHAPPGPRPPGASGRASPRGYPVTQAPATLRTARARIAVAPDPY